MLNFNIPVPILILHHPLKVWSEDNDNIIHAFNDAAHITTTPNPVTDEVLDTT